MRRKKIVHLGLFAIMPWLKDDVLVMYFKDYLALLFPSVSVRIE